MSIRKIFARPQADNTSQELIETQDAKIKELYAKNDALLARVEELEGQDVEDKAYQRGRLAGLGTARVLVAGAEGRPGKRQLAELLDKEIDKLRTGVSTRDEGVED